MDDIFVNEDISKPENRVNLALFHFQMNNEFHNWFCEKLKIETSSVIYPIQNTGSIRPDFIVKNGEEVLGCIEVELGRKNESQNSNYEKKYKTVFSITGKKEHGSHFGLDEIEVFLKEKIIPSSNSQTKLSAEYLVKLIQTYTTNNSYSRNFISDKMANTLFVRKLLTSLIDYQPNREQTKAEPNNYYVDTIETEGFSFRVYSPFSKNKSISLFSITKGSDCISFLSAAKYRQYLKHKSNDVNNWIDFITQELKLPINEMPENRRLSISISTVLNNFETLINNIKPLI